MHRLIGALFFVAALLPAFDAAADGGGGGLICPGCTSGKIVGYNGTALTNSPLSFSGTVVTDTGSLILNDGSSHAVTLQNDGANNILAQRNGTNAQIARFYYTYTDALDNSFGYIDAGQTTANTLRIGSTHNGTTAALTKLELDVDGTNKLDYGITRVSSWTVNATLYGTDFFSTGSNGFDAANGAYFFWATRSAMSSPADGQILFQNAAAAGFTRLELGGITSSFPAIKVSGAALNFRLADDSADANITAAGGTFSAPIIRKGYTVATLPASPGTGAFAYVTDAVACTFLATLTGGASAYCPVGYNGSAWVGE